jgi:hypothetical protein
MLRRFGAALALAAAGGLAAWGTAACGDILGLHDETIAPDDAAPEAAPDAAEIARDAGSDASADADAAPSAAVIETFAMQEDRPFGIAVDGAFVYWLDEGVGPLHGKLVRKDKIAGSPAVTIATSLAYPRLLASDAVYLYVAASNDPPLFDGGVDGGDAGDTMLFGRAPKDAPAGSNALDGFVFGTDDEPYKRLALFDGVPSEGGTPSTDVFLAQETAIVRFARDGSSTSVVASGLASVSALAVDESFAYFATRIDRTIARAPLDGSGGPTPIAHADAADVALDADTVYWVDTDGSVSRAAKDGSGAPAAIAAGKNAPIARVGVSGDDVFWIRSNPDATGDGDLYVAPKSGGPARVLATGLDDPRGIAVDRDVLTGRSVVYVTCHASGKILRVTP